MSTDNDTDVYQTEGEEESEGRQKMEGGRGGEREEGRSKPGTTSRGSQPSNFGTGKHA